MGKDLQRPEMVEILKSGGEKKKQYLRKIRTIKFILFTWRNIGSRSRRKVPNSASNNYGMESKKNTSSQFTELKIALGNSGISMQSASSS